MIETLCFLFLHSPNLLLLGRFTYIVCNRNNSLYFNLIFPAEVCTTGAIAIMKILPALFVLKKLELIGINEFITMNIIKKTKKTKGKMCLFNFCSLQECKFGDEGAMILASVLPKLSALKRLNVSGV